jgi:CheY-like chemotaxis protein
MEIPATQPVILVVASDPLEITALSAALQLSGYDSYSACGTEPALKVASQSPFDLVVCDVNLQGHSGEKLRDAIRNIELNRETPFLFLSATQTPDVIRRSHQSEGVFYLRKPYDPKVLLDLVDRALWLPHLVNIHLHQHDLPTVPEQPARQSPPPYHFDRRPHWSQAATNSGGNRSTEDAWQF